MLRPGAPHKVSHSTLGRLDTYWQLPNDWTLTLVLWAAENSHVPRWPGARRLCLQVTGVRESHSWKVKRQKWALAGVLSQSVHEPRRTLVYTLSKTFWQVNTYVKKKKKKSLQWAWNFCFENIIPGNVMFSFIDNHNSFAFHPAYPFIL